MQPLVDGRRDSPTGHPAGDLVKPQAVSSTIKIVIKIVTKSVVSGQAVSQLIPTIHGVEFGRI